ncbi:DUF2505 domain-containing protein [Nocardioides sp. 616]|uniref:DUF2505 domain-containing protein n=1 Tax=Nocardioides sp. 616 TaxID=2268090 RepID=UPI000CE4F1B5|nr:DUF2505 domain-containing protein [Nocardioides sp. 616]
MTKRIHHVLTYDAPLDAVAAMLLDPAFRDQVCQRQHVLSHSVQVEETPAGTQVRVQRVQAASGIPSFAAKFVGDRIDIVQTETWQDARADYTVSIPGKPGQITGVAELAESAGVTTETVTLDVKVSIPLVGGKIEGLVHDLLVKALRTENTVGTDYLASRPV